MRPPHPHLPLPPLLAAVIALGCSCGESGDPPVELPTQLEALAGDGGVALFLDRVAPTGATLEATPPDGDGYVVPLGDTAAMVDPDGAAGTAYALTYEDAPVVDAVATPLPQIGVTEPAVPALFDGEAVLLTLQADAAGWTLARGDTVVWRTDEGDVRSYLDPACADDAALGPDCWLAEPAPWAADAPLSDLADAPLALPPYTPDSGGPRVERIGSGVLVDDGGAQVLAGATLPLVVTGTSLRWGDPHAHTNLSHDGCEDPDDNCAHRLTWPGEDAFDHAFVRGLDFAALTDHGEWDVLHSTDLPAIDIWEASMALVDEALAYEADGFVPLLGYEWTYYVSPWSFMDPGEDADPYQDEFVAGHKTVLFRQTDACFDYRVGAPTPAQTFVKGDSGLWYDKMNGAPRAGSVDEFAARLADAAETCEPRDLLVYFHHTGYLIPTPVNWALPENAPIDDIEMLIEIASEHGSWECMDPLDPGCAFRVNDQESNQYLGWGSVQAALRQGYRLGFVGGTDSHDGRPGSLEDGPSTVAHFIDTDGDGIADAPTLHFCSGALTGVYVDGAFDRDSLWDGLTARHTLATTGPQGPLAVVAIDADGGVALPGDVVAADRFPLTLWVRLDLGDGVDVESIDVVEPDGATLLGGTEEGSTLRLELADPGTSSFYVRVRAWEGDTEHRVWFSPLFIDR